MTLASAFAFILVIGSLAAIPSSSVALVVVRSATLDIKNGLATAAGIVAGDLIFLAIAILGMSALAEQVGTLFVLIKYLAAAFLIWFGIGLIRDRDRSNSDSELRAQREITGRNLTASFMAGLLLTLGDVKAIFFYASLLPTFLDLARLTATDILLVSAIIIVTVGGVKAAYAVGAQKVSRMSNGFGHPKALKLAAGGLMICAGAYLMIRG